MDQKWNGVANAMERVERAAGNYAAPKAMRESGLSGARSRLDSLAERMGVLVSDLEMRLSPVLLDAVEKPFTNNPAEIAPPMAPGIAVFHDGLGRLERIAESLGSVLRRLDV